MTRQWRFIAGKSLEKRHFPLHLAAILGAFATLGIAGITLAAPTPPASPATGNTAAGPRTNLEVVMDARLGGLRFGSISLSAAFEGERYEAKSVVRTEGITDHVFRQVFDLTASGGRAPGFMQTASYQARNIDQDNVQLIDVAYGPDGAPLVAADPPYDNSGRVPTHTTQLRNTVDPLSAMIVPQGEPTPDACDRKIPVYDGRRRYDFVMSFERMSTLSDTKGYTGPVVRCNAVLVPIAGYKRETIREMRRDPMPISVWLAPVSGAKALVPARIEVSTPLGTLVARSTQFLVETGLPAQSAAHIGAYSTGVTAH